MLGKDNASLVEKVCFFVLIVFFKMISWSHDFANLGM